MNFELHKVKCFAASACINYFVVEKRKLFNPILNFLIVIIFKGVCPFIFKYVSNTQVYVSMFHLISNIVARDTRRWTVKGR